MDSNSEERGRWRRRGGLVWPVVLVALGLVFLLNNLGVIDWDLWWTVLRIWPVLLIAAGIDVLLGYRSTLGAILALVLIVAVVAGAFWLAASTEARPAAGGERISYALDGAEEADVELSISVAVLRLSALSESSLLVEGDVTVGAGELLDRRFAVSDGRAELELSGEQMTPIPIGLPGRRGWDLRLNEDVDLDLDIAMGVGQADIDLSEMRVSTLAFDAGVGQATVTLAENASAQVGVSMGVGVLALHVPDSVEASIRFDTGLVARSVPPGFERRGDYYYTPGYDGSDYTVDVDVDMGVGLVTVSR
jgi:hypothetical protein